MMGWTHGVHVINKKCMKQFGGESLGKHHFEETEVKE
jgi:hypothetical protein